MNVPATSATNRPRGARTSRPAGGGAIALLLGATLAACSSLPWHASPAPRSAPASAPSAPASAEPHVATPDSAGAPAALPAAAPAAAPVAPPPAAAAVAPAPLPPARQALADGIHQYYVGLYAASLQSLGEALQLGLDGPVDQVSAHKFLALDHCAAGRQAACRAEFGRALQIFPGFQLDPDEDADPRFGAAFASARKSARR